MVVVQIIGGLGNQLFQYAFKMAYDSVNNEKCLIDNTAYKDYLTFAYQLDLFHIENCVAGPAQIQQSKHAHWAIKYKFPFRFIKKCRYRTVKEKIENIYEPELLHRSGDVYFSGYFQTPQYFEHIRDDILRTFKLKKRLNKANSDMLQKIKKSGNAVSVHIRRGDYLKFSDIYGCVTDKYYDNAMKYIADHIKKPKFFVFSDDIQWCRDNIPKCYDVVFVDINDGAHGYFDMELMKNCKHNIIANSSFSWWGAWLNENPNKIVIAPKQWFNDNRPTDIIPKDWIKM